MMGDMADYINEQGELSEHLEPWRYFKCPVCGRKNRYEDEEKCYNCGHIFKDEEVK